MRRDESVDDLGWWLERLALGLYSVAGLAFLVVVVVLD